MSASLVNSTVATGLEKVRFITIPKKDNAKECSNHCTIALISHASKVMLKIFQARVQRYRNWELPHVQAGSQRGRETRDQIANIHWIMEKAREFQKNICFIDYAKALDCVAHNKLWKILRWEYQTLTCLLRNLYAGQKATVRTRHEQWTGSKLGKGYSKAVYCRPAYLTSMQNTSCEMPNWMKIKLESRLPGEISTTSDLQMAPL